MAKNLLAVMPVYMQHMSYDRYFASPWASEEQAERRHKKVTEKVGLWLARNDQDNGIEDTEIRQDFSQNFGLPYN